MLGGCCTLVLVPLLAILVGTGLVKVDLTPLCCAAGKLLPNFDLKGPDDKSLLVPNKDLHDWADFVDDLGKKLGNCMKVYETVEKLLAIKHWSTTNKSYVFLPCSRWEEIRSFLQKVGLKGGMSDANGQFPLQGVYMFDQMGPAAWIDFSMLKWDPSSKAADANIFDCTAQAGVPDPKFGGIGPFIPGSYLLSVATKGQYKVRFFCPPKLHDGEHCLVADSIMGQAFPDKYEAGAMLLAHDAVWWRSKICKGYLDHPTLGHCRWWICQDTSAIPPLQPSSIATWQWDDWWRTFFSIHGEARWTGLGATFFNGALFVNIDVIRSAWPRHFHIGLKDAIMSLWLAAKRIARVNSTRPCVEQLQQPFPVIRLYGLAISVSVCISHYFSSIWIYLKIVACGLTLPASTKHVQFAVPCSCNHLSYAYHAWGSAEFCKFWIYWPCRLGSKQFLAFSKSLSEFLSVRKRQHVCRILLGSNKAIVFGGDGRRFKTPHGRAVRTGH